MRKFKINQNIEIVCDSQKTRNGFKHTANLFVDGKEIDSTKCCYLNRTWESYEYQSVILKLIDKSNYLSVEQKKFCTEWANGNHTDWTGFNTTLGIAKLGDIFCDNQKDKNDWKLRMLKAGFENKGLIIPEDWNNLDEATKKARLDMVIAVMGEGKK